MVARHDRNWICLGAAILAALWFAVPAHASDEIVTATHDEFALVHMASLPQPAVDEVAKRTTLALRRVSAWLQQADSYQGSPYSGTLRVLVDPEKTTPTQMRMTIFVPESRVRAAYEANALAAGDFAIVHEVTHVLAVSAFRENRNRFYDDGLAVYLQHKFGPVDNYPVNGPDIHVAVAELVRSVGALLPLSKADQARRDSGDRRRLGYLQLGSFTQFLIENYGIDAYMRIYQGEPLEDVTGMTFEDLEAGWQQLIKSL